MLSRRPVVPFEDINSDSVSQYGPQEAIEGAPNLEEPIEWKNRDSTESLLVLGGNKLACLVNSTLLMV
jgi:hypothetical protein